MTAICETGIGTVQGTGSVVGSGIVLGKWRGTVIVGTTATVSVSVSVTAIGAETATATGIVTEKGSGIATVAVGTLGRCCCRCRLRCLCRHRWHPCDVRFRHLPWTLGNVNVGNGTSGKGSVGSGTTSGIRGIGIEIHGTFGTANEAIPEIAVAAAQGVDGTGCRFLLLLDPTHHRRHPQAGEAKSGASATAEESVTENVIETVSAGGASLLCPSPSVLRRESHHLTLLRL